MDRLIEFAYTASISVGEKCVIHVMNGAVMYQIDSVVKACCDFLVQQLDPSNAIGIANFAEQIGCTELHQKAREYIYMNFSQVKLEQHFSMKALPGLSAVYVVARLLSKITHGTWQGACTEVALSRPCQVHRKMRAASSSSLTSQINFNDTI